MDPKIDYSQIPKDLIEKGKKWEANSLPGQQLRALKDIADMTQELINVLDKDQQSDQKTAKEFGAVLLDIKESLNSLDNKATPDAPDYASPVVEGLKTLQKAIIKSLDGIDVKPTFTPNIQVDAPQVNVSAPKLDLSGISKVLQNDLPLAFRQAIALIPSDEPDDYTPITDLLQEQLEHLAQIETQSRLKPMFPVSQLNSINANISTMAASAGTPTAPFSFSAKSDDGTYTYYYFEDASDNWYIRRKNQTTLVHTFTRGTGGYSSVYTDSTHGPSGSPTFENFGSIF